MSTTDVGFIDKGGIQYRIEVEGNGQERLDAFRQSLVGTRRSFRAFRRDIQAFNSEARGTARSLEAIQRSSRALDTQRQRSAQVAAQQLRAGRDLARQSATAARTTRQQAQAEKRLTDFQRERARLQRQLSRASTNTAQQREIRRLRQQVNLLNQVARAEQRLNQIRTLASQGRDIQTGELFAEQQKRFLLEEQNKLKRAQATLANDALRQTRAELFTTEQIVKAEQRLANEQRLRAQGRLQTGLTPEQTAFRGLQQQLDQLRLEETQQRLRRTNGEFRNQAREVERLQRRLGQTRGAFGLFNRSQERTESQANRISFTFRRLIGIFAAFQALRLGADFFAGAIRGGIQFNALIERAELGVASLFTAVGEVRDPFGNLVSRSQQLAQAQAEARRQTQLLRADSLQTLATFEQLLDTFQVAVAPGFAAGLGVDQIRQLSVSISQAAAAIGVPQEQLAEEIRSLLSGTIQARTTRIATALGITNEDIRRARELGVLSEFLQERFEAFGVAGEEALTTFDGLIARVRDGFAQLSGAGGIEFFEEIKLLLRDIIDFLQFQNPQGFLEPNPEALAIINALLSGLTEAVRVARELRDQLTLQDLFSVAQGLGNAIAVVARVIAVVVRGVVAGVATLGNLFGGLLNILEGIASFFGASNIESFLATLIQVATVFVGIQIALGVLGSLFSALLLPIRAIIGPLTFVNRLLDRWGLTLTQVIRPAFTGIARLVGLIASPIGLVVAGLIAIGVLTKQWLDDLFGVELTFNSFVRIFREALVGGFEQAILTMRIAWLKFAGFMRVGFQGVVQGIQESALGFLELALDAASVFSDSAEQLRRDVAEFRSQDRKEFVDTLAKDAQEIADAEKALRDARQRVADQTSDNINQIVANNDLSPSFLESLGLGDIVDGITSIFDQAEFDNIFDGAELGADTLVAKLDQIPAVIGRGQREVDDLAQSLQQLDDQIRQAQGQLDITTGTGGLDGTALNVRRELLQGEVDLRELARKIEEERSTIQSQQISNQIEFNRLLERERTLGLTDEVQEGVRLAGVRNTLLREEATLQEELRAIQRGINNAQAQGDDERLSALDAQRQALEDQLRQTQRSLAVQEQLINQFPDAVGDPEAQEALNQLIIGRIGLQAQEIANEDRLAALREQQLRLEEARGELATTRIASISQQELRQLEERAALVQAELQSEQLLFAARSRFGNQNAQQQLAQQQARILVEQRRFELEQAALERQRIASQQNIEALNAQVVLADQRLAQVRELAAAQLASAAQVEAAEQAVVAATAARDSVLQAQTLELAAQTSELGRQELALQELRLAAEQFKQDQIDQPITQGLTAGLDDFIVQAQDTFNNFRELASSALTDLSGAFADEILTALQGGEFGEALGAALQGIARRLLQNAIEEGLAAILSNTIGDTASKAAENAQQQALLTQQQAIVTQRQAVAAQEQAAFTTLQTGSTTLSTAVASLAAPATTLSTAAGTLAAAAPSLSAASSSLLTAAAQLQAAAVQLQVANSTSLAAGAAEGGLISSGGAPSAAHFKNPQGLAAGGKPRVRVRYRAPRGLHPSDRIPIWAAKGEFMQPVRAVQRYGLQAMEAIRRGMIDPAALNALVGARAPMRVATPKLGFQTGGAVTRETTGESLAELSGDLSTESTGAPLVALIGEDEADLFFSQGMNGLLERMSQERSKFRSALGV